MDREKNITLKDKKYSKVNIYIIIDIKEKNIIKVILYTKVNIYLTKNGMENYMIKMEKLHMM